MTAHRVWDPVPPGLDVLDQRDDFAVINKPAGLRSVPGRGADAADSVETRVRARWADASGPIMVHRLDVETSGLLVVGLTAKAHQRLSRQFMHRKVGKAYVGVLDGVVAAAEGAIDLPLVVDWPRRPHRKVCAATGKAARTLYRVVDAGAGTSRVEFRPMTGRTHQLRVHAATSRDEGGLGCPIVGDTLYGRPGAAPPMLLHAEHLAFWAPGGDFEWVKYRSAAPF